MQIAGLCTAFNTVAPPWLAADWDNVGLLVGDRMWPLRRCILTIDLTPDVLDEAIKLREDAIVSYHPPIFRATKRLIADRATPEGLAALALSQRIAIYSPHTALDAAPGGTNDVLASLAGLTDLVPFQPAAPPAPQCKLVVFVPTAQVDRVADAVFAAGAGRIGDYEKCSYRLSGHGTFFGNESTNPVVGEKGRLERVDEIRLEVIFPKARLADVVAAVRASHPYEEPAFDIYPLEGLPQPGLGQGRIGSFPKAVTLRALARQLIRKTTAKNTVLIGRSNQKLRRAFVCVGAAGSLPFETSVGPLTEGDVVLTGEIRHHDALRYQRSGASAIALGHWASERPVLASLAINLRRHLPQVSITLSRRDTDPFVSPRH